MDYSRDSYSSIIATAPQKKTIPHQKKCEKNLEIWFIVLYLCDIKMILPTKKLFNHKKIILLWRTKILSTKVGNSTAL